VREFSQAVLACDDQLGRLISGSSIDDQPRELSSSAAAASKAAASAQPGGSSDCSSSSRRRRRRSSSPASSSLDDVIGELVGGKFFDGLVAEIAGEMTRPASEEVKQGSVAEAEGQEEQEQGQGNGGGSGGPASSVAAGRAEEAADQAVAGGAAEGQAAGGGAAELTASSDAIERRWRELLQEIEATARQDSSRAAPSAAPPKEHAMVGQLVPINTDPSVDVVAVLTAICLCDACLCHDRH
jgi:hypothetical protein